MTLHKLNDLDLETIGSQISDQTDNLKSTLRDAAQNAQQTVQARNPLPLSKKEKKSVGDALATFGLAAAMLFLAFLFYRAIVKSGVKAALKEHDEDAAREWEHDHYSECDHADLESSADDEDDAQDD
ncbi:hypothetical protein [Bifidobacterium sp.]|jgi:hypothetical protein|uniref:hypothetical protein n=1 Tax=Bifidobacterium sp. TaxID=41200 RepID=UPI0025C41078|nr:hypothetical protein [Bifidobacterium sp.]MCH4209259.1 hypothetical protein [Bifidobacterium sp.]MCI1224053.1 hypothetical protein [Bifidobacterium sp.]